MTEIETPQDDDTNFGATGRGPAHDELWTLFDNIRRQKGPAQGRAAFQEACASLTDDRKDAIRAEENAHAAALQALADAEQKAREKELNKMDTTKLDQIKKLAHDVDAGRVGNYASKHQWLVALRKASEEDRQPNETREQAFTRYSTNHIDGRVMWSAMKNQLATTMSRPLR